MVNGRIIGVDVVFSLVCIGCKSRNVKPDDEDQFIQCLSCNTSMLKEFLKPTVNANLVIINENGENLGKFHCSGTVLKRNV